MPKIGQQLSFTFRIGSEKSNQFCKVGLDISDIDTSLPIEPQIEDAKAALNKIWKFVYEAIDKEMKSIED